jgi:protein tyrosine/serine phosphatase
MGLLILAGCCTQPKLDQFTPDSAFGSIPRFAIVSKTNNVYRGGQPTPAGFQYLHDVLHVRTVVKLDTDAEGLDSDAERLGMTVVKFPIRFSQQLFGGFDQARISALVQENYHDTFIHCLHGEDRTGLACYFYETRVLSVPQAQAISDMLSHGFHKELHGLWEAVEKDPAP